MSHSLWVKFMWNKYVKGTLFILNDPPSSATRYWRDIQDFVFKAIEVSRWDIGKGDVTFFLKIWLGQDCLCDTLPMTVGIEFLSLREAFLLNFQLEDFSQQHISQVEDLSKSILLTEKEDKKIWSLNNSGIFSVKSYYLMK